MVIQKKDRRIKACPNTSCERSVKKYKYKPTEHFCTVCGETLIYVCANCFKQIADDKDMHRFCRKCQADRKKDKAYVVKKVAGNAVNGATVAIKDAADVVAEKVPQAANAVKENAPVIAKKAMNNKVVKNIAGDVANIAIDSVVKTGNAKKVAKVVVKNLKKM